MCDMKEGIRVFAQKAIAHIDRLEKLTSNQIEHSNTQAAKIEELEILVDRLAARLAAKEAK